MSKVVELASATFFCGTYLDYWQKYSYFCNLKHTDSTISQYETGTSYRNIFFSNGNIVLLREEYAHALNRAIASISKGGDV